MRKRKRRKLLLAENESPLLEDVLIAFQKSLAKVNDATENEKNDNPNYLLGLKNLYGINSFDVELRVNIQPKQEEQDTLIRCDFNKTDEKSDVIRFKVEPQIIDEIDEATLILARDRAKEESEADAFNYYSGKFYDKDKKPLSNKNIQIELYYQGAEEPFHDNLTFKTDILGEIHFALKFNDSNALFLKVNDKEQTIKNVKDTSTYVRLSASEPDDSNTIINSELLPVYLFTD